MLLSEVFKNGREKSLAIPEDPKSSGWHKVHNAILEVAADGVGFKAEKQVSVDA